MDMQGIADSVTGMLALAPAALVAADGAIGLDQMLINFADSIYVAFQALIYTAMPLVGISLIGVGVVRLAKHGGPGFRGTGAGTVAYFTVGAVLVSLGYVFNAMTTSIFGGLDVADQYLALSYKAGDQLAQAQGLSQEQFARVLTAVYKIVGVVGLIAFFRGLFILKAHADGSGQASMGQGAVFMTGGVLAWNVGSVVGAICNSMGLPVCT